MEAPRPNPAHLDSAALSTRVHAIDRHASLRARPAQPRPRRRPPHGVHRQDVPAGIGAAVRQRPLLAGTGPKLNSLQADIGRRDHQNGGQLSCAAMYSRCRPLPDRHGVLPDLSSACCRSACLAQSARRAPTGVHERPCASSPGRRRLLRHAGDVDSMTSEPCSARVWRHFTAGADAAAAARCAATWRALSAIGGKGPKRCCSGAKPST